jgi:hypothetical protein
MHTIYRTQNLLTGEFYIGVHKTTNPDDSYLGSGALIKKQLREFGPENFRKTVLFVCDSGQEAARREVMLIAKSSDDEKCLNLSRGGELGCGPGNYPRIDRQKLYDLLVKHHDTFEMSTAEIAKLMGCGKGTVINLFIQLRYLNRKSGETRSEWLDRKAKDCVLSDEWLRPSRSKDSEFISRLKDAAAGGWVKEKKS